MQDCIFCKIVNGDIPAKKVYEDDKVLVFHDINPVAPIHLLLIPKQHIPHLMAAEAVDEGLLGHLQLVAGRVAKDLGLEEKGFRLVTNNLKDAGQVVFHLHYHLLAGRPFGWPPG